CWFLQLARGALCLPLPVLGLPKYRRFASLDTFILCGVIRPRCACTKRKIFPQPRAELSGGGLLPQVPIVQDSSLEIMSPLAYAFVKITNPDAFSTYSRTSIGVFRPTSAGTTTIRATCRLPRTCRHNRTEH